MQIRPVIVGKKTAMGIEIQLGKASLVLVTGAKGYLMCGYLNLETAERLGDAAAVITGIKTIEDLLKAKVVNHTSKARKAGIRKGMTGLQALKKIV